MNSSDLESHITNEGLVQHITFLATAIKTVQGGTHEDGEDSGLAGEEGGREDSLGYNSGFSRSGMASRIKSRGSDSGPFLSLGPPRIKSRGPAVEADGHSDDSFVTDAISKQISTLKDELENTYLSEIKRKDTEISQLKVQMSSLEKKVQGKETENEDRGFRLSLLENVSYDGTMIWKIPQFAQRMTDAQSGKYTSIFSLPYYTSRYGYKLCLRLYILGDGIGKGTHMSLFFVVMRGEFDNILQWPFTHKVTFRLLNQGAGQDVVDSFLPDPMSSSFKKPKTDMNVASGCPRFVSISDVKTGGFIADDTIFIKVKVDTTGMKLP